MTKAEKLGEARHVLNNLAWMAPDSYDTAREATERALRRLTWLLNDEEKETDNGPAEESRCRQHS